MENFDLIIVGSGSGNSIPDYLSDARIALVERDVFGGTCLNRGCIPSKMFVLPADLAQWARHGDRIGVQAKVNSIDFASVRDRTFGRIDAIAAGGEEYRASGTPNVTLLRGTAAFTGPHTMAVAADDGSVTEITAPSILLAAGARPHMPEIPGIGSVTTHTSDTIMRLEDLPPRLTVIGSGFIAAEMAHVFDAYGSDVTMFARSGCMLRAFDPELSDRFTQLFSDRVNLITGVPQAMSESDGVVTSVCPDGTRIEADAVLVATGRQPNADLLAPEAAGLELTDDGRIKVDASQRTNVAGIWAIGDVANPYQLKHLANREAATAFWNIAHPSEEPRTVDYRAVPAAVFADPQVATVGLTEAEAEAQGFDVVVGRRDYGGTGYGWALADETSFAKVVIERDTNQILGAQIMGPAAATVIQPLIQAIQFKQSAHAVATEVFYIHPALSEVIENALLDGLEQKGIPG